MEILGERPVWSMNGAERLSCLDALDTVIARLQTYRLRVLAGLDEIDHAQTLGARDTIELLSVRHRLDPRDVRRDLRLATALPKYQAVSAALDHTAETGTPLRPAQAEAIVSVLERLPDTVPVDDLEVAEAELVKLGRQLHPGELRKAAQRARDILDTDGSEPAEKKAYAREALWLKNADQGVKFGGYLANENAELLRALIHAGARPHKTVDGELDPRPRDKRQADALTTILTTASNATAVGTTGGDAGRREGGGVPGHGPKAHITVTIDLEDLKAATAEAVGDLVYGDSLSAAAVRRLACDAQVIPVVLGSNSQPLDVGMAQRFVTPPIRRALNTRDKGCVVCGAPPINCVAHHLIHWADGGPTGLWNLVLLCRAHHQAVHDGHWTIKITAGVVHVTRPAWADPDPHPPFWITPEEATRLNPWGDTSTCFNTRGNTPTPTTPSAPATRRPKRSPAPAGSLPSPGP